jgi:recombination protein RecR
MYHYPASIRNVIKQFAKLPGIGTKTAERLAMHVLRTSRHEAAQLADSILELKAKIRLCAQCFALSDGEVCHICADPGRDATRLCVVEQPADMASIEKAGGYNGHYHILQGVLSPIDGIGPDQVRLRELLTRVQEGRIEEVILATGTTVEGEATAAYLAERLARHTARVTRIASGVPMGGDLKYVDQVTLKKAMETRHVL